MPQLTLYGEDVHTVFDLLGDKEDDITYSLGWALSNSDRLGRSLLTEVFGHDPGAVTAVLLQEPVPGAGRTDIELVSERAHLILEAKRGWNLPLSPQLEQYSGRFKSGREAALLVVAECSREFATPPRLARKAGRVPIHYLPWAEVAGLVDATASADGVGQAEKRLLRELLRYLKGVMTMQNVTSNMVYVVSLGKRLFDSGPTTVDVLLSYDRYWCPAGGGSGGWPKTPPNYLGFRFDGRLQQIRHVKDYDIQLAPWEDIPELAGKVDEPEYQRFVYEFGPVIQPPQEVRTGRLFRAQRVWAALDLLLTCETIAEARDETNERLARAGEL